MTITWVMEDVRLAVEKGYSILQMYEVYEYRITQYYPETKAGGLFVNYNNTFLKLKVEASGYPDWVRRPVDEERYIHSFWEIESIVLDKASIEHNAAKRGLAKLCLVSMWGKSSKINNRS